PARIGRQERVSLERAPREQRRTPEQHGGASTSHSFHRVSPCAPHPRYHAARRAGNGAPGAEAAAPTGESRPSAPARERAAPPPATVCPRSAGGPLVAAAEAPSRAPRGPRRTA